MSGYCFWFSCRKSRDSGQRRGSCWSPLSINPPDTTKPPRLAYYSSYSNSSSFLNLPSCFHGPSKHCGAPVNPPSFSFPTQPLVRDHLCPKRPHTIRNDLSDAYPFTGDGPETQVTWFHLARISVALPSTGVMRCLFRIKGVVSAPCQLRSSYHCLRARCFQLARECCSW